MHVVACDVHVNDDCDARAYADYGGHDDGSDRDCVYHDVTKSL